MSLVFIKKYTPLLLTAFIMLVPLVGLAAGESGYTGSSQLSTGKLVNPLSVNNFCDLIKVVLQAILVIGVPIAVMFLVYVGFKFVLAQGNPEKIKEAQRNFFNTIIGIAIFLGALTIAEVIQSTLSNLGAYGVNACK